MPVVAIVDFAVAAVLIGFSVWVLIAGWRVMPVFSIIMATISCVTGLLLVNIGINALRIQTVTSVPCPVEGTISHIEDGITITGPCTGGAPIHAQPDNCPTSGTWSYWQDGFTVTLPCKPHK